MTHKPKTKWVEDIAVFLLVGAVSAILIAVFTALFS